MNKYGLISYDRDNNAKCEIYIQGKMTRALFPQTKRNYQKFPVVRAWHYPYTKVLLLLLNKMD